MFKGKSLFAIIHSGGLAMYILLFCSVLSLAVIIERLIYYRKKARQNEVVLDDELSARLASTDNQSDVASLAIVDSDIMQMQKYISKLRGDYADVLLLHYVQDLPISEVANALGKSEGAVRVMLHRALEELRGFYEQ